MRSSIFRKWGEMSEVFSLEKYLNENILSCYKVWKDKMLNMNFEVGGNTQECRYKFHITGGKKKKKKEFCHGKIIYPVEEKAW